MSVDKEGPFSRSGINDVDEAEIFEGNENTLVMTQTYTHTFQCQYMLQKYPFDTQVSISLSLKYVRLCFRNALS